jgi:hypothetical protein
MHCTAHGSTRKQRKKMVVKKLTTRNERKKMTVKKLTQEEE